MATCMVLMDIGFSIALFPYWWCWGEYGMGLVRCTGVISGLATGFYFLKKNWNVQDPGFYTSITCMHACKSKKKKKKL